MSGLITQKRFVTEALEAHNKYRKLHNVQPLELDAQLNREACEWAEHLAEVGELKYRSTFYNKESLGENILRTRQSYLNGGQVTDEWYKESNQYNYYDTKFKPEFGHFTQLVWRDSKKVGFGFAQTEDGRFYAVANYSPAGNYKGEFEWNVLPAVNVNSLLNNNQSQSVVDTNKTNSERRAQNYLDNFNSIKDKPAVIFDAAGKAVTLNEMQNRFINESLHSHNSCRRKHDAEPLILNAELCRIAQAYAVYLADIKSLVHSTNTYRNQKMGENLAYNYDSRLNYYPGETATMQWYNEIKDYNFAGDYQKGTGHFTQLVWKSSKEVGFGVARATDGSFYAVANYWPVGNVIGFFKDNITPPH